MERGKKACEAMKHTEKFMVRIPIHSSLVRLDFIGRSEALGRDGKRATRDR